MRLIDESKTNEAVRKILRKYGFSDESIVADEVWEAIENEVPTAYNIEEVIEKVRTDAYMMSFDESQVEILIDDIKQGYDIELPEPMEIKETHIDEYICPHCGIENGCVQGIVSDNDEAMSDIQKNKVSMLIGKINDLSLSKLNGTIFHGNYVLKEDVIQVIEDIFE